MKLCILRYIHFFALTLSCTITTQRIYGEEFTINDELRKQAHIIAISYYNTCFFSSISSNFEKLEQKKIELTEEIISQVIALDHSCAGIIDMLIPLHTQSTLSKTQKKLWNAISDSEEYKLFISQDQNTEQLFLTLKNKIDKLSAETLQKVTNIEEQKEIVRFSTLIAPAKMSLIMQEKQNTAKKISSANPTPAQKKSGSPFDSLAVPEGGVISKNRNTMPIPNDLFQQKNR